MNNEAHKLLLNKTRPIWTVLFIGIMWLGFSYLLSFFFDFGDYFIFTIMVVLPFFSALYSIWKFGFTFSYSEYDTKEGCVIIVHSGKEICSFHLSQVDRIYVDTSSMGASGTVSRISLKDGTVKVVPFSAFPYPNNNALFNRIQKRKRSAT